MALRSHSGVTTEKWPPRTRSGSPFRGFTSAGVVVDKSEVKLGEEETQSSGNILGFLLQCCSYRDRTNNAQAKIAAATGRPPPPSPKNNPGRMFTQTTAVPTVVPQSQREPSPRHINGFRSTESDSEGSFPATVSHEVEMPPFRSVLPKNLAEPAASGRNSFPIPNSLRSRSPGSFGREKEQERSAMSSPMRPGWEWPVWCLVPKEPCIEVFVEDEDTGESRWVDGEPQNRVVNANGNDVFINVEYEWEGEFFNQDFGPQHVRKQGDTRTVMELCCSVKGCHSGAKSGRMSNSYDTGGGISALLEDTIM